MGISQVFNHDYLLIQVSLILSGAPTLIIGMTQGCEDGAALDSLSNSQGAVRVFSAYLFRMALLVLCDKEKIVQSDPGFLSFKGTSKKEVIKQSNDSR